jgi:predicted DNA-binding transcriptional regulator AlpA
MARARANGATVWLTATELADRLKVAQSTLWQWNLRNYGPPAVRIGGKLRYRVEAVEAWERQREEEAAARAR